MRLEEALNQTLFPVSADRHSITGHGCWGWGVGGGWAGQGWLEVGGTGAALTSRLRFCCVWGSALPQHPWHVSAFLEDFAEVAVCLCPQPWALL